MQAVELEQFREAAIGGLVGRQGIVFEPAVATVAIKVFAGVDVLVNQGCVEDAQLGRCRRGRCCVLAESGGHRKGRNQSKAGGKQYSGSGKTREYLSDVTYLQGRRSLGVAST